MAKTKTKTTKTKTTKTASAAQKSRRAPRLSQTKLPRHTLEEAISVAQAIQDELGGDEAASHHVAMALDKSPTSSSWRSLSGAAVGYGLTTGAYNADMIALTELGRRCITPTIEGDDVPARAEASVVPSVMRGFFEKYNRSKFPSERIAKNVLSHDFSVPNGRAEHTYEILKKNGEFTGLLAKTKTGLFVSLTPSFSQGSDLNESESPNEDPMEGDQDIEVRSAGIDNTLATDQSAQGSPRRVSDQRTQQSRQDANTTTSHLIARKVFITHGKNRDFINPIKELLGFGELEPVVSVEKQSVSLPVPDKVMNDMRSCGAAIIHVDSEDSTINPNVLIEIGAAMALYGRRFILLVRDGVKLPSNLQGLFEVRYQGDALDGNVTIRLLKAITDIKNHPMPERYISDN